MKNRYLLFVISLLFSYLLQAQEKIDSLLVVLDRTIENTTQYEQARLKRIDQIKEYFRSRKSTSPSEEYHINQQLFDEYEAYICDSARHYINRNIEIALQYNNQDWLNEAKLKKASILGKTGLYAEGVALLKSIDSKQLSKEQPKEQVQGLPSADSSVLRLHYTRNKATVRKAYLVERAGIVRPCRRWRNV